uniref:Secreted protein n=1 Tax=Oryza sativa subsp. japonica TaxID=39947 RepID=Q67TR7_ORYSJ|nr:hypothetical protein [Oryza sativa Japonica Group]BAD38454.1 hypothetical protein [Oryza sativa Japonica Group]
MTATSLLLLLVAAPTRPPPAADLLLLSSRQFISPRRDAPIMHAPDLTRSREEISRESYSRPDPPAARRVATPTATERDGPPAGPPNVAHIQRPRPGTWRRPGDGRLMR